MVKPMNKLKTKMFVAVRQAIEECSDWTSMDKMAWYEVEATVKDKIRDALKQEGIKE